MSDGLIHLAMATDDNYASHAAVAISSILKNLSEEFTLHLYILIQNISDENRYKIEKLRRDVRNFDIRFIEIDVDVFKDIKYTRSPYISKLSAARFLLPEILCDLDKCIYLDVDLIVRANLAELWSIDVSGHVFGAVEEPAARDRNKHLGIPDVHSHCNTGVLILNLKKLREIDLVKEVMVFLNKGHQITTGDQDILNAMFFDRWLVIAMKWNVTVSMYWSRDGLFYYKYGEKEISEALENPAICHFTEGKKPDSFLSKHPYRKDYLKYRKLTEWRSCPLKDVNLKNVFVRFGWAIRNFFYDVKRLIRKSPVLFVFLKSIKSGMADILRKVH